LLAEPALIIHSLLVASVYIKKNLAYTDAHHRENHVKMIVNNTFDLCALRITYTCALLQFRVPHKFMPAIILHEGKAKDDASLMNIGKL
jgi:hypothetical protein